MISNHPSDDQTSTAAVDSQHLKVEVADYDFPNCSYVIILYILCCSYFL